MADPTELPTDALPADGLPSDEPQPRAKQAPDVLVLLVGLASLLVASMAIVGYVPELPGFDPRWLLAGGAAVVGLLLLVSSLRRPRDRSSTRDRTSRS